MIETDSCIQSSSTHAMAGKVRGSLSNSGHLALKQLEVSAEWRTITLSGRVPTYYLKQVAQTVAKSVEGVTTVINDTVVAPTSPR